MGYVSHADLGGTTGHGPIQHEPEGTVFHQRWEARALALTMAAGASGRWNIDMSRRYRETLPDYAELSYYEIWVAALERLLVDRGLVTAQELTSGHRLVDPIEVRDYRIDGDDVLEDAVVRDSIIGLELGAVFTLAETVDLEVSVGSTLNREVTIDDEDGDELAEEELDNAAFLTATLTIGF